MSTNKRKEKGEIPVWALISIVICAVVGILYFKVLTPTQNEAKKINPSISNQLQDLDR